MYFEPVIETSGPVIKVIGVGGGGGNAVAHMVEKNIEGAEFFVINTDAQALKHLDVAQTLQIGTTITRGLGAGAIPSVGRCAAEEDRENIKQFLEGADMVFIAAGMGGGTGTGAAPVVAEIAKELDILTVAVVTKPFAFEGKRRKVFAEEGIKALAGNVHSLITIPNDKLLKVLGRGVALKEAFSAANDVLLNSVQGIVELITKPGMINVDFSDVKTVMSEKMGIAMMGVGRAKGDNRAKEAVELAFSSPLLEDMDLSGAKGIVVNIAHSDEVPFLLDEFDTIGSIAKQLSTEDASVIIGTSEDSSLGDEIKVTVVVAGIDKNSTLPEPIVHANATHAAIVEPVSKLQSHEHVPEIDVNIPAFLRKDS